MTPKHFRKPLPRKNLSVLRRRAYLEQRFCVRERDRCPGDDEPKRRALARSASLSGALGDASPDPARAISIKAQPCEAPRVLDAGARLRSEFDRVPDLASRHVGSRIARPPAAIGRAIFHRRFPNHAGARENDAQAICWSGLHSARAPAIRHCQPRAAGAAGKAWPADRCPAVSAHGDPVAHVDAVGRVRVTPGRSTAGA
jgi:hypothetical protein